MSNTADIQISSRGVATATFSSVGYAVKVRNRGKTGLAAKAETTPVIETLLGIVSKFATEAGIDMTRLKTDFSVGQNLVYDNRSGDHEQKGYLATYSLSFTGTVVEAATKLHDALTSVEGAEVASPNFIVDNSAEVENRAFANAVDIAKARFNSQCTALGLDPRAFRISSWHTREERLTGKMMAVASMAGTQNSAPVEIEPGQAESVVLLTLVYSRLA